KSDLLGERYDLIKLLDLGDVVGVAGPLFTTKTGEVTLRVEELTLLAKSLRPLPLGKEDAQGVRHGELAAHPEARAVFRARARVVSYVRRFLDGRGYLEVETPVLQPLYGGAAATPFTTFYEALDATFYLRIADELYLKRCIVGGLEKVYEIGHDFRNEGVDRWHNPEFTMDEWYEAYADYEDMLNLTEAMVAGAAVEGTGGETLERGGVALSFKRPFARRDFYDLVKEAAGVDLDTADEATLRGALKRKGVADADQYSGAKLMDEVFKTFAEPTLVQPTFVMN